MHPVQAAMVARHGSQCGFCTPGIVMALVALWLSPPAPGHEAVEEALQGNLCSCTGYAPILRVAEAMGGFGDRAADPLVAGRARVAARLAGLRDGRRVEVARGESRAILPADVEDFAALLAERPDAVVVAGATDVGLWVTKGLRRISPAIFVGHLDALRRIETRDGALHLGAGASYAEAQGPLVAGFPHLTGYWSRIGGPQVRAAGTIGGNIANGSPIGDTPPVLIALAAEVVLRRGDVRRVLLLEDFFLDYGRQDRAPRDFTPLTDWRGTAAYRMKVAQNLFRRFWLDHVAGPEAVRLERA